MRTFFEKLPLPTSLRRQPTRSSVRPPARHVRDRVSTRSEDGFLLIEVIVSALLVALIVIGTFNGFDAVNRTTTNERQENLATVIAAESQEQLRSDPASTFDTNANNFEHVYTKTIAGTTYTVTQQASYLNGNEASTACAATNTTRQASNSLKITSAVTWPQLLASKRPAVTESSTVTPPPGSALEVDVGNYPTPTAGVAGVTSTIKYTPPESTTTSTLEGTTETPGCIVFGSLPATSAIVEIAEKPDFVDPAGAWQVQPKEVTIAPNYTTHYPVVLNEGGAIQAEFTYEGKPEYVHLNNAGTKNVTEKVTAESFVAFNEKMGQTPEFELGSANGHFTEGQWEVTPGTYAHTITTPKEPTKYPNGNLFPFVSPGAWKVYAGACTENDPYKLSNATITDPGGLVPAGKTFTVTNVPMAYLLLGVYTGSSKSSPGVLQETTAYPIKITNTACKNIAPNDEEEFNEPKSEQKQTISSTSEYPGHLEHPFVPLGAGKLCLQYNSGGTHRTYTSSYNITAGEQYPRNFYLGASSSYTETVKRSPSTTSESATVEVAKPYSGEAICS
jgi:Tfp pilus assembly protein PilV